MGGRTGVADQGLPRAASNASQHLRRSQEKLTSPFIMPAGKEIYPTQIRGRDMSGWNEKVFEGPQWQLAKFQMLTPPPGKVLSKIPVICQTQILPATGFP
jgi:hypothetical protein